MTHNSDNTHFVNSFLCSQERQGVVGDEDRSYHDTLHALDHVHDLVQKNKFLPNKVIGKAVKFIKVHHTLKYNCSVSCDAICVPLSIIILT